MEKERADSISSVEMVEGLFSSPQEYEDFVKRHAATAVRRYPLTEYTGAVWMGIDAGSTTLKAVLIDKDGAILREWYGSHRGNVISRAKEILLAMYEVLPSQCRLAVSELPVMGKDFSVRPSVWIQGKWKLWRIFGLPDFSAQK